MKTALPAFIILSMGLFSCSKVPKPLTRQQIQAHIDSVTTYRMKDIDARAQVDLDRRLKIEVKVKVDSILHAQQAAAAKDTAAKKPVTVK